MKPRSAHLRPFPELTDGILLIPMEPLRTDVDVSWLPQFQVLRRYTKRNMKREKHEECFVASLNISPPIIHKSVPAAFPRLSCVKQMHLALSILILP